MSTTIQDVIVVGAGPGGATAAFYLARQGKRVRLLEKKVFPRDKICGDAVSIRAQRHLDLMGVLNEITSENKGRWARSGGIVSPNGFSYYADSSAQVGRPLMIAVKRLWLDEKIANAAARAGAELVCGSAVEHAELDKVSGVWTITADRDGVKEQHQARVLICADGANSALARRLGIIQTGPDAICSRSYVSGGTHTFEHDGVVVYPRKLLPGYAALFKEADEDVNICVYIIPGGEYTIHDLRHAYDATIQHPAIARALGSSPKIEKMRGAPLRLGGIPKSYADHLLIVGDAAGQIDPLTGEGIQYAMDAGEFAAQTVADAFVKGNFGESTLRRYHSRWMRSYGWDFWVSQKALAFYTKTPELLDAFAVLAQKRGPLYFAEWGKLMTGMVPKSYFLKPHLSLPMFAEIGRMVAKNRLPSFARSSSQLPLDPPLH